MRAAVTARLETQITARFVALGVATVDSDRWCAERALPAPTGGPGEPALGARSARLRDGAVTTVLLEPATEGRLAAALARHGEGPVCVYLDGGVDVSDALPSQTTALGRSGRLVRPGSPAGPFVILLD